MSTCTVHRKDNAARGTLLYMLLIASANYGSQVATCLITDYVYEVHCCFFSKFPQIELNLHINLTPLFSTPPPKKKPAGLLECVPVRTSSIPDLWFWQAKLIQTEKCYNLGEWGMDDWKRTSKLDHILGVSNTSVIKPLFVNSSPLWHFSQQKSSRLIYRLADMKKVKKEILTLEKTGYFFTKCLCYSWMGNNMRVAFECSLYISNQLSFVHLPCSSKHGPSVG